MKLNINKPTRVLILTMSTLVLFTILIVSLYYKYQNQSVDPRIVKANELYSQYNDVAKSGNYHELFQLMNSIETIYASFSHYKDSYEVGVLYNNRGAAFLAKALDSRLTNELKDSLLYQANENIQKSINIYNDWLSIWDLKNMEEINQMLKSDFGIDDSIFMGKKIDRYLNKRAIEIREAQLETYRRLSVSHTNLGMIARHNELYEHAVKEYFKALEYWPDNLSAENNLNILLKQPLKKPNILRRIFPKDRME